MHLYDARSPSPRSDESINEVASPAERFLTLSRRDSSQSPVVSNATLPDSLLPLSTYPEGIAALLCESARLESLRDTGDFKGDRFRWFSLRSTTGYWLISLWDGEEHHWRTQLVVHLPHPPPSPLR